MNFYLILAIYVIVINITSFITMKIDKELAKKHMWRISEKTLFLLALFLGATGIFSGMYTFRHKTKHISFAVIITILIIINIICIYFLVTRFVN